MISRRRLGPQGRADDRQQALFRSVAKIQGDLAESARINAELQKELNDLRAELVAEGTAKEAQEQIRALGATNIIVRSVKPSEEAQATAGRPPRVLNYGLKYSDYDRMVETIPNIRKVLPVREIRKQIRARRSTWMVAWSARRRTTPSSTCSNSRRADS